MCTIFFLVALFLVVDGDLYEGCQQKAPSNTFCVGSKNWKIDYRGKRPFGCVYNKNCEILIKGTKKDESNFKWQIALEKRENEYQSAEVLIDQVKHTEEELKRNKNKIPDNKLYMFVDTNGSQFSMINNPKSQSPSTIEGRTDDEYYTRDGIKTDGKYQVFTFKSGKKISFQEKLTQDKTVSFVDFTGPASITANHKRGSNKEVVNRIVGLHPINLWTMELTAHHKNKDDDEKSSLLWLWILLAILLILFIIFLIWLLCRRKQRYAEKSQISELPTSSTNSQVSPQSTASHRSSAKAISSAAGPNVASDQTTTSLRSKMPNSSAVSAAGNVDSNTSKRSKMTVLHSSASKK